MKARTFPGSLPMKRVQQRDIAESAGVSISTVSRVLNNVSGISDELRRHVLEVAEKLGYYDAVTPAKLQHIALFTRTFSTSLDLDTFHTAVLHGVEAECRQHDIQLSYSIVEPGESGTAQILKKIKERQIEGALLVSIDNRELVRQLLDLDVPVVVINDDYRGLPVDTFLPDNFTGGLQATQYLLARGHRRILHVTCLPKDRRPTLAQRFEGYRVAQQEAGIPFERGLLLESNLGVEEVRAGVRKLLSGNECQFSAIFCTNDEAAIGAMRGVQDVGKRVPEDVAIIGFDDIATAALLTPALTTLHVDCKGMGVLATRRLVDRFHDPDTTPVRVELTCKLIERQSASTAPVEPC